MNPIKTEVITIRKCEKLKNRLFVAIFGGEKFTKILFLNKSYKKQLFDENEESLRLDLVFFHCEDLEYALKWIRDNAYIPEGDTHRVHVTGSFTVDKQNQIKSILNRDVLYIEEYLAIAVGCKFALDYIGVENLLAKPVEFDSFGKFDNELMEMFTNPLKMKLKNSKSSSNTKKSSLFYVQGSSSACYYYDGNGLCEYFDSFHSGNQAFFGLAKCLLNTNVPNETIELASKGNSSNVDILIKEKFDGNIESPYGKFPSEIPIFSFGKCEDYNIGLEDLSKEDLSASLMGLQIENILMACTAMCFIRNISRIYVCGSLFDFEEFRKIFLRLLSIPFYIIEPEILDFKESAVLGALIYEEKADHQIMKSSITV